VREWREMLDGSDIKITVALFLGMIITLIVIFYVISGVDI
jgi:hypothetical protein